MPAEERLIIIEGVESSIRADTLTRSQELLLPYADSLITIWAVVWVGTLTYLLLRYLLAPSLFESPE